MWHVSSRSGVAALRTAIHLLLSARRRCRFVAVGLLPARVVQRELSSRPGRAHDGRVVRTHAARPLHRRRLQRRLFDGRGRVHARPVQRAPGVRRARPQPRRHPPVPARLHVLPRGHLHLHRRSVTRDSDVPFAYPARLLKVRLRAILSACVYFVYLFTFNDSRQTNNLEI